MGKMQAAFGLKMAERLIHAYFISYLPAKTCLQATADKLDGGIVPSFL
jgi:hypothetical protein